MQSSLFHKELLKSLSVHLFISIDAAGKVLYTIGTQLYFCTSSYKRKWFERGCDSNNLCFAIENRIYASSNTIFLSFSFLANDFASFNPIPSPIYETTNQVICPYILSIFLSCIYSLMSKSISPHHIIIFSFCMFPVFLSWTKFGIILILEVSDTSVILINWFIIPLHNTIVSSDIYYT